MQVLGIIEAFGVDTSVEALNCLCPLLPPLTRQVGRRRVGDEMWMLFRMAIRVRNRFRGGEDDGSKSRSQTSTGRLRGGDAEEEEDEDEEGVQEETLAARVSRRVKGIWGGYGRLEGGWV
jgi:hypothetical protein